MAEEPQPVPIPSGPQEQRMQSGRILACNYPKDEVALHAQETVLRINKEVINYQDMRDYVENLIGLHTLCIKKDPDIAQLLGKSIKRYITIIAEAATTLERIAQVIDTDWNSIGNAVVAKLEKMKIPKQPPFTAFVPKMQDFKSIKLLGAGGFGAVYLATYVPANFVSTIKLVAMDRFAQHQQAAVDKIVASVIRHPFLVKYYSCFCVKESYVTIMEYIAGLDLMRVVSREIFLTMDALKIVMAQLILALEHMHIRGFIHRDVKVSNMLIIPGGRVKTIDFDTIKVCQGHFSKRLLRGYLFRTAYEFKDGESAGTLPYMAAEVIKRRPYGRAADWWSTGVTFYKMATGRVPFRGKTKQILRERIISAPLRWPPEGVKHTSSPASKDMTYRFLKRDAQERLGSRSYAELKNHDFFGGFNWKRLYDEKELVDIPSVKVILAEDAKKTKVLDPEDTRKHQEIHEMTDIAPETQKPLLCYFSPSFKRLMLTVKAAKKNIEVDEEFMNTAEEETSGIDYGGKGGTQPKKSTSALGEKQPEAAANKSPENANAAPNVDKKQNPKQKPPSGGGGCNVG